MEGVRPENIVGKIGNDDEEDISSSESSLLSEEDEVADLELLNVFH